MADTEIESFLTKFKHLCSGGINASLNISSSQGKAIVTLHAEIGAISAPTAPQTSSKHSLSLRSPHKGSLAEEILLNNDSKRSSLDKAQNLLSEVKQLKAKLSLLTMITRNKNQTLMVLRV